LPIYIPENIRKDSSGNFILYCKVKNGDQGFYADNSPEFVLSDVFGCRIFQTPEIGVETAVI